VVDKTQSIEFVAYLKEVVVVVMVVNENSADDWRLTTRTHTGKLQQTIQTTNKVTASLHFESVQV
jgi:hypothetical protein